MMRMRMGMSKKRAIAVSIAALLALVVRASDGSVVTQQCGSSAWSNHLFLVNEGTVTKVDLEGQHRKPVLENQAGITKAFDYSHARKTLYYADYEGLIWALQDGASEPVPAVPRQTVGRWLPCDLRVDDLGQKMYVVECFSGSINVFDLDTGDRAVVLAKNFTEIRALEIDAQQGYLFIVDKFRILRAELDGSNPVVLHEEFTNTDQIYADIWETLPDDVKQYLKNPDASATKSSENTVKKFLNVPDIALDVRAKRLYTVDSVKRRIESFDYEGNDRRIHFQDSGSADYSEPAGSLSLLGGRLYWLDSANKKLFKINIDKENQSEIILKKEESQTVLAVGCPEEPLSGNPCAYDNGQCQHLCIYSRSSEKSYVCACKIGYELARDGQSCIPTEDFILYAQSGYLRGHSMNISLRSFSDVISPTAFSVGRGTGIQYNAADGIVYYASLYPNNKLHQVNLLSGEVKILQPDLLSSKVGVDMAYDWESRNLYYFTYYYKDTTTLSVMNVDDPSYSKILVNDVPRLVRAIAVHPYKGYVFYAQMSDDQWTTISRMATDGSGLKVIVSKKGFISDLTIDFDEDRLYWCEPQKLLNTNLDGEDLREMVIPNPPLENLRYFAMHKNYLYTISRQDQVLTRLDKDTLNSASVISYAEETGSISAIEIYAPSSQTKRPGHPCGSGHSCHKFCFPVPAGYAPLIEAVCGCPYGEKLSADGRTCEDNRREEPPFIPCHSSFLCEKKTEIISS